MASDLKEVEAAVMKLPAVDRAALAERLIQSLDVLDEAENERLWLDEAERRYQAYKEGRMPARIAADAIRDARKRIQ